MSGIVSRIIEVYPFRFSRDRVEYLVLKRAADEKLYPGIWQVVTGSMEANETAVQAALREFHEETGFTPLRFWEVPQVGTFYERQKDEVHCCPLFASQVSDAVLPVLSAEHEQYRWVSRKEGESLLLWPSQRETLALVDRVIVGGEEAGRWLEIGLGGAKERKK